MVHRRGAETQRETEGKEGHRVLWVSGRSPGWRAEEAESAEARRSRDPASLAAFPFLSFSASPRLTGENRTPAPREGSGVRTCAAAPLRWTFGFRRTVFTAEAQRRRGNKDGKAAGAPKTQARRASALSASSARQPGGTPRKPTKHADPFFASVLLCVSAPLR
jgi:hypothetical protein